MNRKLVRFKATTFVNFSSANNWLVVISTGSLVFLGSLVFYQSFFGNSTVASNTVENLEGLAYFVLALFLLGLSLAFVGVTLYLRNAWRKTKNAESMIARISRIVAESKSTRIFILAAIGYGLFYSVVSSTLVFQPNVSFTATYGVHVPSIVPVVCCGALGQMPQFVVYLTQQFAILIIPLNLALLFTVSWLVGLNAAILNNIYTNRPVLAGARWMTGVGAFVGLFTACPTCAGFFFLTVLGLGGAVGVSLTLASLQTFFIGIGIPILAVTPLLAARGFSSMQSCELDLAARS
jgi:hypothetical protein